MLPPPYDFTRPFEFLDSGVLIDRELSLVLVDKVPADPVKQWVPWYAFEMRVESEPVTRAGHVNFRPGNTPALQLINGHFGYSVERRFRGHHYAERSVRLLFPLARQHGFESVIITANPENLASRRTIERLGGVFLEIVAVTPDQPSYARGDRFKCRYRVDLPPISLTFV